MLVLVEKGTVNGDSAWQLVTDGPVTLGTSALAFEMAFGRTGVAAGTYRSVTIDVYGRVVAAANPTTVAGYGLTDVYTKTQTDQALALKAPLASPALTGIPTAPTPAAGTNSGQLANTAFVQAAIASLVASAPGVLDTLNELAAALGNDPNFATTMLNHLALKAPLDSPVLSGDPKAPTPATSDRDTSVATTEFVRSVMDSYGLGADAANQPLITDFRVDLRPGIYRAFSSSNAQASIGGPPDTGDTSMSVFVGGGFSSPHYKTFLAILNSYTAARMYVGVKVASGTQPVWTEITTRDHAPFTAVRAYAGAGVFTWTVPAGVRKAWVTVIGGGGGGGRSSTEGLGSGGGGGGGLAQKLVDLSGITSVTVTVGEGGAGATVAGGLGATGGTSSFGTMLSATGGTGGMGVGNSVANGPGPGGLGSGGDFNTGTGVGHVSYGHWGGSGGGAGARAPQNNQAGSAGGTGGGGSGATYGYNGGQGGAGHVLIQW